MDKQREVQQNSELSLRQIALIIRREFLFFLSKWLIISFAVSLGMIAGLIYAKLITPEYTAECTFVLEETGGGGGGLGQYAGIASMVGIDIGGGSGGIFQGDNLLELYKSRTMIIKTLLSPLPGRSDKLLIDSYTEFNQLESFWSYHNRGLNSHLKDLNHLNRKQDSVLISIVNTIKKLNLDVNKPDKKLGIIRVSVTSKNELFSKCFNDQLVKNVNDFYIQTKTRKSLDNVNILQQKTDSVRSVLNGAIFASATTMDATPNLNITRQILRAPIQKSQFTAETNKAILTELVKNLELSKISLRKETPLIEIIDEPIYPLKKSFVSTFSGIIKGGLLFGFLSMIVLFLVKAISE